MITDKYFDLYENVRRLIIDYNRHSTLYIAFDYDNTIFDYHGTGETYPKMIHLLQFLSHYPNTFKLILFTGNEGDKLKVIKQHCSELNIHVQYVNESPIMNTIKPYFNILLDDRAGLYEAYQILILTLNSLEFNYTFD